MSLIQALPASYRWYVDDYILKFSDDSIHLTAKSEQHSHAPSCDIYKSKCFDKLCSISDSKIPTSSQTASLELNSKPKSSSVQTKPSSADVPINKLSKGKQTCNCEKVQPYTVFGQIVCAVELLCRAAQLLGLRKTIKQQVKWLLTEESDCNIPFDRFPKFSDVIFLSESKFDSLFESLITTVIDKAFSQKCSHVIAKKIFQDRELSVVALFFNRHSLIVHDSRAVMKIPDLTWYGAALLTKIGEMDKKSILKYLNDVKQTHQNREFLNKLSGEKEKVDILDYSSTQLEVFVSGLLQQCEEIRQAQIRELMFGPPACTMEFPEFNNMFCNPVYRQLLILLDIEKSLSSNKLINNMIFV